MNTHNDLERIHQLETDVTVLGRDSDLHTRILEKVEANIDRAETHCEAINRTISVYDERLRMQDKINERLETSIKNLEDKMDNFMVEIDGKLDNQEERRIKFLEDLKKELVTHIDTIKPHVKEPDEVSKKDKERLRVFKFILDNWKVFLIAFGIIIGLTIHNWKFLITVLGFSS